jgi:hypothetical protein
VTDHLILLTLGKSTVSRDLCHKAEATYILQMEGRYVEGLTCVLRCSFPTWRRFEIC